jgi:tetratricopeptide (TPR) repeat protein
LDYGFAVSTSPADPNDKPAETPGADPAEGEAQAESPAEGGAAGKIQAKPPKLVFRDELEDAVPPTLFEDKRYGSFRKQMAFAVGGLAFCVLVVGVLFWPAKRETREEAVVPPVQAATPTPPPVLTPEQIRLAQLEELRGQLRQAGEARDWEAIENAARQILVVEPKDGEAWHSVGWALERKEDAAGAAEAYGQAFDAGFLPAHTLLKRAAMNRLLKKYPEAISDLETSIRLDPESTISPSLLMITQIQAGRGDEVKSVVANYEKVGLSATADRYLLGKAALAMQEGDMPGAALALADFRGRVSPALFSILVQDRFFDPYRSEPALQPFLLLP